MTSKDDADDSDSWNRLGALVRVDQARMLENDNRLRNLELAVQRAGLRAVGQPARRRRARPVIVAALASAMLAAIAVVALRPRELSFAVGDAPGHTDSVLAADQQPLPLQFSDGSVLLLAPASEGEVKALSPHGATVRLARGHLDATVVHAAKTRWQVSAGPFLVHVTGTRFSAAWDPVGERLRITLAAGGVTVQGPLLGTTGLPMTKGQVLSVDVGQQRVLLAPLGDEASPAARPAQLPPAVSAEPAPPAEPNDWKSWALASDPTRAYAAAQQLGITTLSRQLTAPDLLLLADSARFAGAPRAATRVFQALRARFPDDPRAPDAVFGLGVLALDADHQPLRATQRFREYLSRWPEGTLAREAYGRLIEALDKAARPVEARRAAAQYLDRYGDGPHAALARRLLRRNPP